MQEFGSLFQEHYLESIRGSRKTVRNASSHLRSAQGARQGSRPHRPSWLRVAEGSRLPCRGSHPFPTRALHGTMPTPGPPRPCLCVQRRGAVGDSGSCSTPQLGGIFFFFISSHLFLICVPRAARDRAVSLTSRGERSRERSSRDERKGEGEGSRGSGGCSESGRHLPPPAARGVPALPDLLSGGRRRCPAPRAGCCCRRSAECGGSRR